MADGKVTIELVIDGKKAKAQIDKQALQIEESGRRAGKSFGDGFDDGAEANFQRLQGSLNKLRTTFLAVTAAIGAVQVFDKFISAANRQDDAVNKLNASLERIGEFSDGASQSLQDYASNLQAVTRFGDEAIIEQLAFAQSMGASAEQSKLVVTAATDLATALNIDLNSAVRNVAKTLGGYAGELGEVIPELKTLSKEQLQAGEGVKFLAEQFRGLAEKDAKTFSGAVDSLGNSIGDLSEEIGKLITRSEGAASFVDTLKQAFQGAAQATKDFRISLFQTNPQEQAERLKQIKVELIDLEQAIMRQTKILGANSREVKRLQERRTELLTEGVALKKSIKAQTEEQKKNETQNIKTKDSIKVLTEEQKKLREQALDVGKGPEEKLQEQYDNQLNILKEAKAKELITEGEFLAAKELLELEYEERRNALDEQKRAKEEAEKERRLAEEEEEAARVAAEAGRLENFAEGIGDAFKDAAKDINISLKQVAATALNVMARGVGNAFFKVGQALASGQNAFSAFKDALKNVLGDIASATGDLFIKQGIGYLFLNPGIGAGLIAAGAGLKILAGLLSSGGAGGGLGATAGGAGGAGGGPAFEETPLTAPLEETREVGTQVAVNISGDVLDSDETGLRIVNLIQNAFDENDVKVSGGAFA